MSRTVRIEFFWPSWHTILAMNEKLINDRLGEFTEINRRLLKSVVQRLYDELDFSNKGVIHLLHAKNEDYREIEKCLKLLKRMNVVKSFERIFDSETPSSIKSSHSIRLHELNTVKLHELFSAIEITTDSDMKNIPKAKKYEKRASSNTRQGKITDLHPLEPKHYSDRKGVLTLSPTANVLIVKNGKVKRPNGQKYEQCLILEKLFKNVNTLKQGVLFRTILGVNDHKIDRKMDKKIRNTVSEINNKVSEAGGPKNLIKVQNKKVFVNNSYL